LEVVMTRQPSAQSPWQPPAFEEINMSAEIGAYQGDDGDRGDAPAAPRSVEPDRAR
jgi:hypothetical protein